MMRNLIAGIAGACLMVNFACLAEENLRVLPETIEGVAPSEMMVRYLQQQARGQFEQWRQQYEQRKTPEQTAAYQKNLRARFIEAIGGLPTRTPLNAKVTGVVARDGYRVEKVIFESQPQHYVTALLFMPEGGARRPPFPGVIVPCGHAAEAKACESYQIMGASLALNGMAGLVFDPIDQGERIQLPSALPRMWGTTAHTALGVGSILLGRNTARFEIWDGMRAIDYLQSRPEVDPNRIGCTGNSGGGTQTSYLMALDDRIRAAAPSCYITGFEALLSTIGPQDAEQNIGGQLAFGMDHADYLMMRAPAAILICAATKDFFNIQGAWTSFRYAKRLYTRLGVAERIGLLENDAEHNYNTIQREGVVRWMSRWLLGSDRPIKEPAVKLLSDDEARCTADGQVMHLAGARSTYDLNRDSENQLAAGRRSHWAATPEADMLRQVRQVAGIRALTALPEPKIEERGGFDRANGEIKKIVLVPESGISLAALMFLPKRSPPTGPVLYVHEDGKAADAAPGGPIEKLVEAGRTVMAVDLRGIGETQSHGGGGGDLFGPDVKDVLTAYLLGRSYVGMRAEDILICARFLQERWKHPVDLVAVGHVCVPALHAAALEPGLFGSARLVRGLTSWSNVIEMGLSRNQLVNAVHGALTVYDLPDLARTLGGRVVVEQPLNSLGEPVVTPAAPSGNDDASLNGAELKRVLDIGDSGESLLQPDAWKPWGAGFTQQDSVFVCDNGGDSKVQRGASQTVALNQARPEPIIATAWSKALDVGGSRDNDYSLYLDLTYQDGTPLWGQVSTFRAGSHDWEKAQVTIFPEKPIKAVSFYMLLRGHAGKAMFRDPELRPIRPPVGACLFDGVAISMQRPATEGFQVRDVAAGTGSVGVEDATLALKLDCKTENRDGATFFDVNLADSSGADRAVTLVYAVPAPADGCRWFHDPRHTMRVEPGREYVNAGGFAVGSNGRLSRYPFAAVVTSTGAVALGIDMAEPAFFRAGYNAATEELFLAYDLGLAPEKPVAHVRFCKFSFDPKWEFRAALNSYYEIFPESFRRRVEEQGLWMPFAKISSVRNWQDFGFRIKEGNDVTDFKTKWNAEIREKLYGQRKTADQDGEYIDSSEGYVTDELDFRRDHFAAADSPLTFSLVDRKPAIFRGLIAFEYIRGIAGDVHAMDKLMMANATPIGLCWLAPLLDVMGTETDWNPGGSWRPMSDSDLLFRRALCKGKPYCFLMNTEFERFGHDLTERYMKRSLAYGMFPGFFSHNASQGHYCPTMGVKPSPSGENFS